MIAPILPGASLEPSVVSSNPTTFYPAGGFQGIMEQQVDAAPLPSGNAQKEWNLTGDGRYGATDLTIAAYPLWFLLTGKDGVFGATWLPMEVPTPGSMLFPTRSDNEELLDSEGTEELRAEEESAASVDNLMLAADPGVALSQTQTLPLAVPFPDIHPRNITGGSEDLTSDARSDQVSGKSTTEIQCFDQPVAPRTPVDEKALESVNSLACPESTMDRPEQLDISLASPAPVESFTGSPSTTGGVPSGFRERTGIPAPTSDKQISLLHPLAESFDVKSEAGHEAFTLRLEVSERQDVILNPLANTGGRLEQLPRKIAEVDTGSRQAEGVPSSFDASATDTFGSSQDRQPDEKCQNTSSGKPDSRDARKEQNLQGNSESRSLNPPRSNPNSEQRARSGSEPELLLPTSPPASPGGITPERRPDAAPVERIPWATRVWETARVDLAVAPSLTPMREIDLRLPVENQLIDIQLRERFGLLDVSVRTADATLANEIRADLGELVRSLEFQGYETTPTVPDDGFAQRAQEPSASLSGNGNSDASNYGGPGQDAASSQGRRHSRQQRHRYVGALPFSIDGLEASSLLEPTFHGGNTK